MLKKLTPDSVSRSNRDQDRDFPLGVVVLASLAAVAATALAWLMGWGLPWLVATYCLTGSVALLGLAWHKASRPDSEERYEDADAAETGHAPRRAAVSGRPR
jgi:membrane protein implicated in regulation of membrane protease activity